jgi:hypothetical protein
LGFLAGKYGIKSAITKSADKVAEIAQNGADFIKKEFGQSKKDRRNEILFRKFSL